MSAAEFLRNTIDFKLTPSDRDDQLIIENTLTQRGGPPRHLHHEQEEWFYALEGDFIIEVGDERFDVKAGDSLLAPRRIPHVWAFVGEGSGRMLISFMPAGKMEAFFRAAATGSMIQLRDPALWQAHGMELYSGPPLTVE